MTSFDLTPDRQADFSSAVLSLRQAQFANPVFFSTDEVRQLKQDALTLPFRQARSVVGQGVHQDFQICFPAPLINSFAKAAQLLETACAALSATQPDLFEDNVHINDFAVQNYPAGSRGIGIHKDGLRYRNLVFIITLDGGSDLFICADRDGSDRQVIDDTPGRLVILPAPGLSFLADPAARPLHGVDAVSRGRLSIGFRQERKS